MKKAWIIDTQIVNWLKLTELGRKHQAILAVKKRSAVLSTFLLGIFSRVGREANAVKRLKARDEEKIRLPKGEHEISLENPARKVLFAKEGETEK